MPRWTVLFAGLLLVGCTARDDDDVSADDDDDVSADDDDSGDDDDSSDDDDSGADDDDDSTEPPWDPCLGAPEASDVPPLTSCIYTPPTGVFAPQIEWQMSSFPTFTSYNQSMSTPMVANLTDDDGDGQITLEDTPDVAVVMFEGPSWNGPGVLRVLSGDGSGEHWSLQSLGSSNIFSATNPAIGDLDGDGLPEIVVTDTSGRPAAISAQGTLLWIAADAAWGVGHAPAIADLDQDGTAEIIVGRSIYSHVGTLEGEGSEGHGSNDASGWMITPAVADVTGDGVLEVVVGNALYDATGATIWANGLPDGAPAVGNFDSDPQGEIAVVGPNELRLIDDDGSVIWGPITLGNGLGGPPTLADFDGDGALEIGVATKFQYAVYDTNGSVLWTMPTTDNSGGRVAASVFDFDGDGSAEVVFADEHDLWVFDGTTGTVLLQESGHASGTLAEYPTIADVDGDGNAEIIFVSSNYAWAGWNGITVLGDSADNWVSGRPIWNQHAYRITNVEDDGGIPVVEAPNWPTHNTFRAGGFGRLNPLDAPDLAFETYGLCTMDCPTEATWVVRTINQGLASVPPEVAIRLWAEDSAGARTELTSLSTLVPLAAGSALDGFELTIDPSALGAATQLVLTIDDDGLHNECDESNNEVVLALPVCP
jgi:hypothetical protein